MNQKKSVANASAAPTPYELAKLATGLYAIEQKSGRHNYSQAHALTDGLALWLNASELLEKWRTNPASVFPPESAPTRVQPEPKRYPVTLDEFLKFTLPHLSGRTGEKYGLFREYLGFRLRNRTPPAMTWDHEHSRLYAKTAPAFDCCNPRIVPAFDDLFSYSIEKGEPPKPAEPTKDDVDRYFALWQANAIPDHNSFWYHERWFRDWYQTKHAAGSHAAKAENALKGHAKKTLRRRLWEKSTQADHKAVPLKEFPEVTDEQMARLLSLNEVRPLKDYRNWNYDIESAK